MISIGNWEHDLLELYAWFWFSISAAVPEEFASPNYELGHSIVSRNPSGWLLLLHGFEVSGESLTKPCCKYPRQVNNIQNVVGQWTDRPCLTYLLRADLCDLKRCFCVVFPQKQEEKTWQTGLKFSPPPPPQICSFPPEKCWIWIHEIWKHRATRQKTAKIDF